MIWFQPDEVFADPSIKLFKSRRGAILSGSWIPPKYIIQIIKLSDATVLYSRDAIAADDDAWQGTDIDRNTLQYMNRAIVQVDVAGAQYRAILCVHQASSRCFRPR